MRSLCKKSHFDLNIHLHIYLILPCLTRLEGKDDSINRDYACYIVVAQEIII